MNSPYALNIQAENDLQKTSLMYLTFTNNQLLSYMCAKLYRTLYTKINLSHMQYYLFSLVKSYYFLMQQKHYPSTILCQRRFYRPNKTNRNTG